MKYLLDANAVIAILEDHARFLERLARHAPRDFGMSSIVAHELFFGAFRSPRVKDNLAVVEALEFEILDFDREDAKRAGMIRATLAAAGTPIGPFDVLIAGQALARGLTLLTHNMREFKRVKGLKVEDWQ
jgi:tRNA(fMet)-specific endonuclease VapC